MRSWWTAVVICALGAQGAIARDPARLRVLGNERPRAFFFRSAEGFAANKRITYERWEASFERLMGIEGKVLDEEVIGREARNPEFFTRFKRRHRDQLVLLHYNGNARDPRYQARAFFAGHWVYHAGAKILADVPAEGDLTDIRVSNARLFRVNLGRYRTSNDDIGLCELDAAGKPDWSRSEQVQLVSVDVRKGVIRVRRGCYGTTVRAFSAGKAWAAAHACEGPWGTKNHLMWFYNHSTACPRDAAGRTCNDVLVADLARRFAAGGQLSAFDGIEFDVLHGSCRSPGGRPADCDADGKGDRGIIGGRNVYGIGVVAFIRTLRKALGPDVLILADGHSARHQRAFGLLNGIESEGWPDLRDAAISDWSGGMNRHLFWRANAHKPAFSYINHKFNSPGDKPGRPKRTSVPLSTVRLVMAAAEFTDSALCFSQPPDKDRRGDLIAIWDELWMGRDRRVGWLGRPEDPAVRLATRRKDTLAAQAAPPKAPLLPRLAGRGMRFEMAAGALKVSAVEPGARALRFRLAGVPTGGADLVVAVTARADALSGYPGEMARQMHVGLGWPPQRVRPEGLRTAAGSTPARFMTFVNGRKFTSHFAFGHVRSKQVDLEFEVEGREALYISAITTHASPDAIYRLYQNGLILANPSPRPYVFDLAALVPGRTYRRLRGSAAQDPKTNNGAAVGAKVTLGPKNALFLIRTGPADGQGG